MGKRQALIVAVAEYSNTGLRSLTAPANDAKAMSAVLSDPSLGAFDVTTLLNPTSGELRRELSLFSRGLSREDLQLIYFSCHGVLDDFGDLYFATKDTDTDLLHGTAVEAAFLDKVFSSSACQQKIVILDCCYSGAVARAFGGKDVGNMPPPFEGIGTVILTASGCTGRALEEEASDRHRQPLSVFTQSIVDGIQSGRADMNNDGWVTIDELYDFTAAELAGASQRPGKWSVNVRHGQIRIARSARRHAPRDAADSARSLDDLVATDTTLSDAVFLVEFDESQSSIDVGSFQDFRQFLRVASRDPGLNCTGIKRDSARTVAHFGVSELGFKALEQIQYHGLISSAAPAELVRFELRDRTEDPRKFKFDRSPGDSFSNNRLSGCEPPSAEDDSLLCRGTRIVGYDFEYQAASSVLPPNVERVELASIFICQSHKNAGMLYAQCNYAIPEYIAAKLITNQSRNLLVFAVNMLLDVARDLVPEDMESIELAHRHSIRYLVDRNLQLPSGLIALDLAQAGNVVVVDELSKQTQAAESEREQAKALEEAREREELAAMSDAPIPKRSMWQRFFG